MILRLTTSVFAPAASIAFTPFPRRLPLPGPHTRVALYPSYPPTFRTIPPVALRRSRTIFFSSPLLPFHPPSSHLSLYLSSSSRHANVIASSLFPFPLLYQLASSRPSSLINPLTIPLPLLQTLSPLWRHPLSKRYELS